jgi:predicted SPOUT superfamily RNA methylase MTH1
MTIWVLKPYRTVRVKTLDGRIRRGIVMEVVNSTTIKVRIGIGTALKNASRVGNARQFTEF